MTVGLLGGSFDPAHEGHAHVTREAIKRFRLNRVWWLVSPGNPLKTKGPAPMTDRLAQARRVMIHPRVSITDLESRLGVRYTAQTVARLTTLYPGVKFVWLMGADNLVGFHRWERWSSIVHRVPVGVIARPGSGVLARRSKAARVCARAQRPAFGAGALAIQRPPAWCFVNVPLRTISSSQLRDLGRWPSFG